MRSKIDTLIKEKQVLGRKKVSLGEVDYVNIIPKSSINILNNKVFRNDKNL